MHPFFSRVRVCGGRERESVAGEWNEFHCERHARRDADEEIGIQRNGRIRSEGKEARARSQKTTRSGRSHSKVHSIIDGVHKTKQNKKTQRVCSFNTLGPQTGERDGHRTKVKRVGRGALQISAQC